MNACFCAFKLLRRDNNSNTITAFYNLIRENYKDDELIAALNREIRLDTRQDKLKNIIQNIIKNIINEYKYIIYYILYILYNI